MAQDMTPGATYKWAIRVRVAGSKPIVATGKWSAGRIDTPTLVMEQLRGRIATDSGVPASKVKVLEFRMDEA